MFRRLAIVPFEAAIAVLLITGGVAGILKVGIADPLVHLLPMWEAITLNIVSVLSGILTLAGVAFGKRVFESPGLILLMGSIVIRFLLYAQYLGYGQNLIETGIFYAAIIIACLSRIHTINKGHVLIKVGAYKE